MPDYDAINVWPMPTSVTLCGEVSMGRCHGPHTVSPNIRVSYMGGCSPEVAPLIQEALELATYGSSMFHPRRFNEGLG